MSELKSCPFCGDKDPLVEADEVDDGMSVVRCIGVRCGIRVGFFMSEDEAITAWNTRADEAQVRRETIEKCITIISQNTPMEGCYGCETNLYEKLRALAPDSGKVIDATVYYPGKYGAHKPVEAAEENAEFLAHFNAASPHLVNELREALGLIKLPE